MPRRANPCAPRPVRRARAQTFVVRPPDSSRSISSSRSGALRRAGSATILTSTPGRPRSRRNSSEAPLPPAQAREAPPLRGCAHQHVGAPERARHADRHGGHIVALLDPQAGAQHRRQPPQLLQALAVLLAGRAARRAHDEHVELGVQSLGRAPRAPDHALGVGVERRQRQQPLGDRLGGVVGRRQQALLVAAQDGGGLPDEALDLDVLGHLAQGRLPQRREVLDLEEVVQRGRHALGGVDLAGPQTCDQGLGGEVDQDHLVGGREHRVGDRLADLRPRQLGNLVVEALEVLDVDGREHVDARVEHVADVLVALLVLEARRVGVGELVDQAQLGPAREHRRQVHLLERRAPVDDFAPGHELETLGLGERVRSAVGLEVADHDVATGVGLRRALLQHAVGLADPRGHADEDLEMSTFVCHGRPCGTLAESPRTGAEPPGRLRGGEPGSLVGGPSMREIRR